ncbi:MAG: hypothetical protein E7162_00950 [Firmicutes bacterium]|nr:hypothetical protein [Bacillota bacterium]
MAITAVDKIKLNKYLREHAVDDIYYLDMCDALGKRGKISDIEFLEYFTDSAVQELNKDSKISIKQLTKIILTIDAFLTWIHEANKEISDETLNKIRNLEYFYDEYLERTKTEPDLEFKESCLKTVLTTINELYPSEEKSESMTKYINQINTLNSQIKDLRKQLDEITKLYELSQESLEQKTSKVASLTTSLTSSQNESKGKDKEIDRLNEVIRELSDKITAFETETKNLQQEKCDLLPYKEQFSGLQDEIKELKGIIEKEATKKKDELKKEKKQEKISELIYEKLLFESANLNQIVGFIKDSGIVTSSSEVSSILKRIKSKINLEQTSFSMCPSYQIVSPTLAENQTFSLNVPYGSKYYDIMLVSDFHIEQIDSKVLNGFDILNDYCVKNGIHLILNLGDFYQGYPGMPLEYKNAVESYKLVEKSITSIPQVEGIYHAILGGNHDKSIVKYGFDPIGMLAEEREDIINLGYMHSKVAINCGSHNLGHFDIHHPDTFDFPINLSSSGIDIDEMNNYLTSIYQKQNRNRDDSYIDIFGHTHKNQFNYPASYCYIPSFFEGKTKKGACHLRIYFDEDTDIKYMVFMPLTSTTKLVKTNEIIYQKTLKK